MAKIIGFSIKNFDFVNEIENLVDKDHEDVIKRCCNALKSPDISKMQRCYLSVILGSTYYKIGEYEHAIMTLKQALLLNKNDEEAIYYSILSYFAIGETMSYKELFYYLHFIAKNRDLVDSAVRLVMSVGDSNIDLSIFDSKATISLVTEEEKIDRVTSQYNYYESIGKVNKGIEMLTNAISRFGKNKLFLENYIYTVGFHDKHDLMVQAADLLYRIDRNNAPAIMAGLLYAAHASDKECMQLWINRLKATQRVDWKSEHKLLVGLDGAKQYQTGIEFIESRDGSDINSCYLYSKAVFKSKLGHVDEALLLLRRLNKLYGMRSYASEAILTLRNCGEIMVAEYGRVGTVYSNDILMKFALIVEQNKMKELSDKFDDIKDMLLTAIYAGELEIASQCITKLSVATINKNIEFFNNILIDDMFLSKSIKIAIATAILVKSPRTEFKYSYCGIILMSEFNLPLGEYRQMSNVLNKAFAYAYSVGCYNTKDFINNLTESYTKMFNTVVLQKAELFTDYKALGAVMSLGSYTYYGNNVRDVMVVMHECDEKTFTRYLKIINRGNKFYNEEEQDNKFSELLEKFALEFMKKELDDDDDELDNDDDDE